VQHRMAGPVGGGAGALGGALAVMRGHAAERALVDVSRLRARERHAPMLQFVDGRRRLAAEVLDGVLVAEPVGAFDRVVHVPAPVILAHVAERGGDAALRRDRMRTGREDLGDAGGPEARFAGAKRRPQAGSAGADHDDIEQVLRHRISTAVDCRRSRAVYRPVAAPYISHVFRQSRLRMRSSEPRRSRSGPRPRKTANWQ
jgi:hypothetical protein